MDGGASPGCSSVGICPSVASLTHAFIDRIAAVGLFAKSVCQTPAPNSDCRLSRNAAFIGNPFWVQTLLALFSDM